MLSLTALRRLAAGAAALAAVTASAASAETVTVGYIPIAGAGQLFVINGEGWAKEAGIELKLTQFESGPAMISALASGTLDVYYGGIGPLMVASARGVPVKVVATSAYEEMTFVARGPLAEANAKDAAGFKAFFEKNGRKAKLGIQPPGSVPHTTLMYWLQEVIKADPAHYEVAPMGIEATQQALLAGAIDGATIREPTLTLVTEKAPDAKLLAVGRDMFPNQPGTMVGFHGNFTQRAPEAAKKLVALQVRATEMLKNDPKKAAVHVHAQLGKGLTPLETIEKALVSPASKFEADPNVVKAASGTMQDFQVKTGVLKEEAKLDVLFDDSFYRAAKGQ